MNEERRERRGYFIGAALSAGLTALAFGAALAGLNRAAALWVIGLTAVAQAATQLRFFLHIGFGRQKREDLQLILFSLLLLAIMVGGTLWILFNLAQRMM